MIHLQNYNSDAEEYCAKVVNGEILACQKIILAAKRFLTALDKQHDDDYPYYFDAKQAEKAIKFVELIPSTDGSKINALLFQKWIISELYGWKEKGTDNRRYREAMISTARKQGKTWLASAIGALSLIMEDKPAEARQVLFVANSLSQAKLGYTMLFNSLSKARKMSPTIQKAIKLGQQKIDHLPTNSYAKALAAEISSLDGYSGTTVIYDEYALSKNRDVLNTLKSGQKAEPNALLVQISTAAYNLNVPMFEDIQFYKKVLEGKATADRTFIAIYELDNIEEANVENSDMWIKASPIFEHEGLVQTMKASLKDDVIKAQQQNQMNAVLVKSFNMWTQSDENSFMDANSWNKCAVEDKPDIKGKDVYIGLDLSRTNDLSSVSWLVDLGDGRLYADTFNFVGTKEDTVVKSKRDGFDYKALQANGYCKLAQTPSGYIDYEDIVPFIVDLIKSNELNCKGIFYDEYSAATFITKMEKEYPQYELINVRQGYITLSQPTKDIIQRIHEKRIVHNNNPFLTAAVFNAVLETKNDLLMINKKTYRNKIDPLAALINAHTEAMNCDIEEIDYNEYYLSDEFSF